MSEKRDNSGTVNLTKNDKKGVENRPDYKGSAKVAGVDYWVSAWLKDGDYGKFLSLSFTVKEDKPKAQQAPRNSEPAAEFDDTIPF
jgi:hypothetical protein